MDEEQKINWHAGPPGHMYNNEPKLKMPKAQDVYKLGLAFVNSTPDLKRKKKKQYASEKENWISEFKMMAGQHKTLNTMRSNDYKFIRRPIVPFLVSKAQNIDIPVCFNNDLLNDVVRNAQQQCCEFSQEPCKTIGTQTDYRDSESQTIPWEPPYKIKPGHDPELLTIAHLTWEKGLPPGVHELEVINRMRRRKAWEAILPPMDTPANIKLQTAIITALEIDEWAYRESEIQAIMDYRLELMDELTKSRECEKEKKVQGRFERLRDFLSERRDKEVNNIQHKLRRDLRKLRKKHKQKHQSVKRDIIEEHANPSSELYAPQLRHGEHPQRRHEVIRKELLKDTYIENQCVNNLDTLPKWLPTDEELKAVKLKFKPPDLCIRQTRWTEEKLKQLHSELKEIRLDVKSKEKSSLLKRKYKPLVLPSTPYNEYIENEKHTQIDQYSTLIQKMIRGRAIQCMMFEGRNRCRKLIEELQSSHGLDEGDNSKRQKEMEHMLELQRLQNIKTYQEDRLCEFLDSFEGATVSAMLDFLSKELERLKDERRIHAFALLAERERALREAAEAGRRQSEYNRRREFDEMFRQIIKMNQDSVETYLDDIIKESMDWVSDTAAKEYILDLCDKVEKVEKHSVANCNRLEQDELIASMIYNFVLPEVEKTTIRKNIREKQQCYLESAHAVIYNDILNLPPVAKTNSETEETPIVCETITIGEEELRCMNMDVIKDIQSILESIISNALSVSTHT